MYILEWRLREEKMLTFNSLFEIPDEITDEGLQLDSSRICFDVTSDVDRMVKGEIPNYGWRLETTHSDDIEWYSREYSTSSQRPKLRVFYVKDGVGGGGGVIQIFAKEIEAQTGNEIARLVTKRKKRTLASGNLEMI